MKKDLLQWLVCPECQGDIILLEDDSALSWDEDGEIKEGQIECVSCKVVFPVMNGIPRFVTQNNYADNFGMQWNIFSKTQLDSHTKTTISRDRFFSQSGWDPKEMRGKIVLDAGCGSGRFAEIALSAGATVIAIDYSNAVDACYDNLKDNKNLNVVQADIYKLPFRSDFFDYIYSFGVLQHTPDVKKSLFSLVAKLKKGGKIAVDFYRKDWKIYIWPKYWIIPFTRRMPLAFLFKMVKNVIVPILFPISAFLSMIPQIGYYLRYIVPICNYKLDLPVLDKKQLLELAVLDTFDMYSAKYDNPQNENNVKEWFSEMNLKNINVFVPGLVVARAEK